MDKSINQFTSIPEKRKALRKDSFTMILDLWKVNMVGTLN